MLVLMNYMPKLMLAQSIKIDSKLVSGSYTELIISWLNLRNGKLGDGVDELLSHHNDS